MLRKNRAFTLIELLVVISVISLLASVVLVALGSSRAKSKDALLRQQATQYRTLLEQQYSETGSYAGLQYWNTWINDAAGCAAMPLTGNYVAQAKAICNVIVANALSSSVAKFSIGVNGDNINKYSIVINLNKGTWLCVGSSGSVSDTDIGSFGTAGCFSNP